MQFIFVNLVSPGIVLFFSNGGDHRDKSLRSSLALETIFCALPKSAHGLPDSSPAQLYVFRFRSY